MFFHHGLLFLNRKDFWMDVNDSFQTFKKNCPCKYFINKVDIVNMFDINSVFLNGKDALT